MDVLLTIIRQFHDFNHHFSVVSGCGLNVGILTLSQMRLNFCVVLRKLNQEEKEHMVISSALNSK